MSEPQPFEAAVDAMIAKAQKPSFWSNLKAVLVKKHEDYGRSGVKPPELAPHISATDGILVRESDKLARLRQLQRRGYTPKVAESIEDTALDLVGYAALLYVAIRHEQQQAASAPVPEINEVERYIRATLASPHTSEATKEGVRRRWPSFGAHFDEPQATGGNL